MSGTGAGNRRTERFSGLLLRYRGRTNLTQRAVAARIGVSLRTVQGWETGLMYPGAPRLQALIAAVLEAGGLSPGREAEEAEELWSAVEQEASRTHPPFEHAWFAALMAARAPTQPARVGPTTPAPARTPALEPGAFDDAPRRDWADAPAMIDFVGRAAELGTIRNWIVDDRCRLVVVLGMGGVGKTGVAAKVASELAPAFERVYWRGLRNAPSFGEWVSGAIAFLSGQRITPPDTDADQLDALLTLLRERPTLLVLDNFETLLQPGQREAGYRDGFAGYGTLLQAVSERNHLGSVLVTSREAPPDWGALSGSARALELGGLGTSESQALLATKQLSGDPADWNTLIARYGGNCLALKVVGESIRQVFGGDIAAFLAESGSDSVFGGIRRLLAEQFDRSSPLEQDVLRTLAVEREPVTIAELIAELGQRVGRGALVESVEALRRRSLVELAVRAGAAAFTLLAVVLEYVTDRTVAAVCDEIEHNRPVLLVRQPLIKAQAKDYVRQSQERLIGDPILQQLQARRDAESVERMLVALFEEWRGRSPFEQGYGPGNVVNLLRLLRGNLRKLDLSRLILQQADFAGIEAQDATLRDAVLTGAVLTEALNSPIALALSGDGARLAVGTWNGELWLWRVADRTPLLGVPAHVGPVHAVALTSDGRLLASGSEDGTVQVWSVADGQRVATLEGHTSPVYGVALSDDGRVLASGSFDGTIRIWSVPTRELIGTLAGHSAGVWTVSLTADGDMLASGSFDGAIRVWDVRTLQSVRILDGGSSSVWSLRLSRDGRILASGGEDARVRLWDVSEGRLLQTLHGHTGAVRAVSLSADARVLASASWDRSVRLWDTTDGRPLATIEGHTAPVRGVALTADARLVASVSLDDSVRLWEAPEGRPLASLKGYAEPVYGVALSSDGRLLASGNWDGAVRLWDVTDGELLTTFTGHTSPVYGVAISANGRVLASGSYWDRTIRLWDLPTRRLMFTLTGHTGAVRSVALTDDGAVLASGSWDTTVRLWDVRTGLPLTVLRGHTAGVRCVAFSGDGRLLASGALDGIVRVWAMPGGELLASLEGHANPVYGVALSADGRLLASGGWDGEVRIWQAPGGPQLHALRGHRGEVRAVALSAAGHILASGGFDGAVRLWELPSGRPLATLTGHTSPIYHVALAPDGGQLASSGFDGTVRVWDTRTGTCERVLRRDRPFERMDISGLTGVTAAQYSALLTLGAIDAPSPSGRGRG